MLFHNVKLDLEKWSSFREYFVCWVCKCHGGIVLLYFDRNDQLIQGMELPCRNFWLLNYHHLQQKHNLHQVNWFEGLNYMNHQLSCPWSGKKRVLKTNTLESGIDVGQGIIVGPEKFVKKNKHWTLNKRRAWTKCAKLCYKKTIKLENICRPWKKFQNLINVGPLIRL